MTDEFRSMIESKRNASAAKAEPHEANPVEIADDKEIVLNCYSTVSADRMRKIMLELRYKSGNSQALAYSYLLAASFDPSQGIVLDFGGKMATISGINLRPLYDALVAQRVAWVRELDSDYVATTISKTEVQVVAIDVVEPLPD